MTMVFSVAIWLSWLWVRRLCALGWKHCPLPGSTNQKHWGSRLTKIVNRQPAEILGSLLTEIRTPQIGNSGTKTIWAADKRGLNIVTVNSCSMSMNLNRNFILINYFVMITFHTQCTPRCVCIWFGDAVTERRLLNVGAVMPQLRPNQCNRWNSNHVQHLNN